MSYVKMQQILEANPSIGRKVMSFEAGVSEDIARRFLEEARHPRAKNENPLTPNSTSKTSKEKPPEVPLNELTENKRLKQTVRVQQQQIEELLLAAELLEGVSSAVTCPPKWLIKKGTKQHYAIATAVLADPHFDEVVQPAEIGGVNAYNREIAQLRLREFFTNIVRLSTEYIAGIKIEGLVLAMAGDIVTGNIHEELQQTNAAAILDTCLFWSEQIAAGIEVLLKHFDNIFIPCVVGNHGRQTRKPRHKGKVRDNFDYLIYALLARYFNGNAQVSFMISESSDALYTIYKTRYCLTHGDQFRGGSGISGALAPLLIGDARKRKRSAAVNKPYDYMVMGHWHQEIDTNGIICCNSLKGYDEYASDGNFSFSEPSQAFWITDSIKGRTLRAPIHVLSAAENWDFSGPTQPVWLQDEVKGV